MDTSSRPIISVWLSGKVTKSKKEFHCPNCGYISFCYYGDGKNIQVMIDAQGEFKVPPKEIICKGSVKNMSGEGPNWRRCGTILRIE